MRKTINELKSGFDKCVLLRQASMCDGCIRGQCCASVVFALYPIEALWIWENHNELVIAKMPEIERSFAIEQTQTVAQIHSAPNPCPFVENNRCMIYESRPWVCASFWMMHGNNENVCDFRSMRVANRINVNVLTIFVNALLELETKKHFGTSTRTFGLSSALFDIAHKNPPKPVRQEIIDELNLSTNNTLWASAKTLTHCAKTTMKLMQLGIQPTLNDVMEVKIDKHN